MEWLVVFGITPLVVALVVSLMRFVGCTSFSDEPQSSAPTDPSAAPLSPNAIKVAWNHSTGAGAGTTFVVTRIKNVAGAPSASLPSTTALTVDDAALDPSTSYTYTVVATESGKPASKPSPPVTAVTPAVVVPPLPTPVWMTAYNAPLSNDEPIDFKGRCLVQRVSKSVFTTAGAQVRVTLRAGVGSDLALHRVFLSGSGAAPDDVDSTSTPLANMRPGGVVVPAGGTVTLAPVNYVVNNTRDLLLAFDISATAAAVRKASHPGSNAFHLANAAQAGQADRSTGYAKVADTVYLVERVEVWTGGAAAAPGTTPLACFSATLTGDGGSSTADCVVVRIPSALLTNSGTRVRLTLRSGGGAGMVIRRLSIGPAAKPGAAGNPTPNEWDSGPDLKEFPVGGVAIPPNTAVTLDPIDYALDQTEDLIVAFDTAAYANVPKQGSLTGPKVFTKASTAEAGLPKRTAGYTTANDAVVLIEKIEVGN